MLKSIFITTMRNLFRNIMLSSINLLGLTVSMSLGLLLIIVINGQFSYDNFHFENDRIFRVNTEALRMDGDRESYASVPLAVVTELSKEYDYVEKLVRLERQMNGNIFYNGIKLPVEGVFVDPEFFEVFNFELNSGNSEELLKEPYEVVLTYSAANKLFGTDNAVGELINFGEFGEFKVTGVLKPYSGRTHFDRFEIFTSFATIESLEKLNLIEHTILNWNNYYTGSAYLKLKTGVTKKQVEAALHQIYRKNYADVEYETRDKEYRFFLQNLSDITPGPLLSNSYGTGMPILLIGLLASLATIIMMMAYFNYTQLMIAKSLSRAKEVGIRKIFGGNRLQIFFQFIGEATFVSLTALILAFVILQLLKYKFSELSLTRDFAIGLSEGYKEWFYFLLFAVLTGFIAGLLPALYISSFNPLSVLRVHGNIKFFKKLGLRKTLLVTQFTFSLVFVMVIISILEQARYLINADYGFNQTNIMNIRLYGVNREQFINRISGLAGVDAIGTISHSLGTWEDGFSDWRVSPASNAFVMRDFYVDENYLNVIGSRFTAGTNFNPSNSNQVILNVLATKRFGFRNPIEAIGQSIYCDSIYLNIAGIISDFHVRPLTSSMEPVAFIYNPDKTYMVSIKFNNNPNELANQINNIWKDFETRPFDWRLLSDEIDDAYKSTGLFDLLKIVGYCGFLMITLSCLGVFGMSMINSQARRKEVAIRRINGATEMEIIQLLTSYIIQILLIAVIIGLPISIILIDQFLSLYAYKTSISILSYLAGIGFVVLAAMLIVVSQTYRIASGQLVNQLQYE